MSVHLADEHLTESNDAIRVSFERLPGLRRVELVERWAVHQHLEVLEESEKVLDESLRLLWNRFNQAANPLLK